MHVYDRLSGGEKAALTRAWQRFSRALLTAEKTENALKLIEPGSRQFDGDITRLWRSAQWQEELAKARSAYLRTILFTWYAKIGPSGPDIALGERDFKGEDLDQVLWENHPVNLFQSIEEAAGFNPEEITA